MRPVYLVQMNSTEDVYAHDLSIILVRFVNDYKAK